MNFTKLILLSFLSHFLTPVRSTAQSIRGNLNVDVLSNSSDNVYDVIIIGAGWAGLSTGRKLFAEGVDNIKILEARDYVGGRSVTSFVWGESNPVDLGSAWVQGVTYNPVQAIIDHNDIPYGRSDNSGVLYEMNRPLTDDEYYQVEKVYEEFFLYEENAQENALKDTDLREIADNFMVEEELQDDLLGTQGLEAMLESVVELEYASDLEEMSLKWWDSDSYLPGGDNYLSVPNSGYSKVIQAFANDIFQYIELNSIVQSIDYSGDISTVIYSKGNQAEPHPPLVARARKVLVTVPLGVLKANAIDFQPPLASTTVGQKKEEAIQSMGMGLLNKIALYWKDLDENSIFWPHSEQWLKLVLPVEEQDSVVTDFYNAYAINGNNPVLVAYVSGSKAIFYESLTDDEMTEETMKSLRQMFGEENVPEPTYSIVTRWGEDQYSYGSYAFLAVGSSTASRDNLAACIDDKVFFAGEATDKKYAATTHGALRSGERAANEILNSL